MTIEGLFAELLPLCICSFFVSISMIGQPVMKNNSGRNAERKHDQHEDGYNFSYGLMFIQNLLFATMLQIYIFLNNKKDFKSYQGVTHLG